MQPARSDPQIGQGEHERDRQSGRKSAYEAVLHRRVFPPVPEGDHEGEPCEGPERDHPRDRPEILPADERDQVQHKTGERANRHEHFEGGTYVTSHERLHEQRHGQWEKRGRHERRHLEPLVFREPIKSPTDKERRQAIQEHQHHQLEVAPAPISVDMCDVCDASSSTNEAEDRVCPGLKSHRSASA